MHPASARVVFMATGDIAIPAFRHLLDHGPRPLALVTQPDKPVGRRQISTPPAIKTLAQEHGIPVLQPEKAGDAAAALAALAPDIIVVFAYGQILRDNILSLPRLAIINLHASLLPKYRGAACIQAALAAGDLETGITSLHVVRQLDAGDLILAKSIPIRPDDTGGTLHDRLAALAPDVLAETLRRLCDGTAPRIPQDPAQVSYVGKLTREDGLIDWSLPAQTLARRIHAYHPWPGSYFLAEVQNSKIRVKIFPPVIACPDVAEQGCIYRNSGKTTIGCSEGALEIREIQPEGKRVMNIQDWLRGCDPVIV